MNPRAFILRVKVILHEKIRNDDYISATQRCNIVSDGYNIIPTFSLKIVVANRLV